MATPNSLVASLALGFVMTTVRRLYPLLAAVMLLGACEAAIPAKDKTHINDRAGVLSDLDKDIQEQFLANHETETSNEIAVLIIPTLDGANIEVYAVKVFEQWQLGVKGKDNGVLLLVVTEDREVRIEVGYGLEGVLTDLRSRRIIDDVMIPAFREKKYGIGLKGGIIGITATLGGEIDLTPLVAEINKDLAKVNSGSGATVPSSVEAMQNPSLIGRIVEFAFSGIGIVLFCLFGLWVLLELLAFLVHGGKFRWVVHAVLWSACVLFTHNVLTTDFHFMSLTSAIFTGLLSIVALLTKRLDTTSKSVLGKYAAYVHWAWRDKGSSGGSSSRRTESPSSDSASSSSSSSSTSKSSSSYSGSGGRSGGGGASGKW